MEGREPTSTTSYEYDDTGRVVRSVTVREPEWTALDTAELLALQLYRQGLCPLHGGPLADCTSSEDTGPQFAVRAVRCRAEDELIAAQQATNRDRPGAVLWSVHTTPRR